MEQKQIDRINELARKAKTPEGLTGVGADGAGGIAAGVHRLRAGEPEEPAGPHLCGGMTRATSGKLKQKED